MEIITINGVEYVRASDIAKENMSSTTLFTSRQSKEDLFEKYRQQACRRTCIAHCCGDCMIVATRMMSALE